MKLQSLCLKLSIYSSWSHTNSLRLSSRTPSHMLKHTIYRPSKSLLQIRIIYDQKKSKILFFLPKIKATKYDMKLENREICLHILFLWQVLWPKHIFILPSISSFHMLCFFHQIGHSRCCLETKDWWFWIYI